MAADASPPPVLGRAHARRLREIYRSAGWPCQDPLEIELLAAGLLDRVLSPTGRETLRLTPSGLRLLADTLAGNRAHRSAHEALVERVALEMGRAGRIAWRGLTLRAQPTTPRPPRSGAWRARTSAVVRRQHPLGEGLSEASHARVRRTLADAARASPYGAPVTSRKGAPP